MARLLGKPSPTFMTRSELNVRVRTYDDAREAARSVTVLRLLVRLILFHFYFGDFSRSLEQTYHNETHGYVVRTKSADSNEGGVMAGGAALDSVYLV